MEKTFLKINKIAGVHYSCGKKTSTIVVYGIGAPNVPDNGTLPDAPYILKNGVDIFVPDYIGFGRSDGKFTPKNCIKTFLTLYDYLSKGCIAVNHYLGKKVTLKYKRIIFIGRSLGAAYVPLLPKYNPHIKELAVLSPALDQAAQGKIRGEETNKSFLDGLSSDGYKYLYKGFDRNLWHKHVENLDGLSPMDNMKYLKDAKLFIAHGKKDKCINFSKSVEYYHQLTRIFPHQSGQFKLKIYSKGDHGSKTTNQAVEDFFVWLKI